MEGYRTEEEQVEAIKRWFRENGKALAGGVIVGVALLWGGNVWKQNQQIHQQSAAQEYQAMFDEMQRGNLDAAASHGQRVLGQYGDTAYGLMAALAMAKVKLGQNDTAGAKSHLRWALDNTKDENLQHVARLRLAQVLLADGEHAEALTLVNITDMAGFEASYAELKGDIHAAMGNATPARAAYARALELVEPGAGNRQLLQMKLDDLGGSAAGN